MRHFFEAKAKIENKNITRSNSFLNNNKLTIFHQNIAGLCNKTDLIELTLCELQNNKMEMDVLCFSEIHVKQGTESNINLTNYRLMSHYCRDKNRGGTCILVNKILDAKILTLPPNLPLKFYFECCGVELKGLGLIVVTVYRIPKRTKFHIGLFLHKLETTYCSLTT
jgi:exonuclease III